MWSAGGERAVVTLTMSPHSRSPCVAVHSWGITDPVESAMVAWPDPGRPSAEPRHLRAGRGVGFWQEALPEPAARSTPVS
jgi:hypothetical protein